MEPVHLTVEGMHCGHCAASVTKALEAVSGVEKAEVDLAAQKAVIWGAVSKEALVKAVEAVGFEAR